MRPRTHCEQSAQLCPPPSVTRQAISGLYLVEGYLRIYTRYLLGMAQVAPYLIGIIVVSVILHYLTIRFVIRQMRVIGDLSEDRDALQQELDSRP